MERLLKVLFFTFLGLYFLGTVVMSAPAEWVASTAVKFVPGLSMSGVTGSVWSGKAAGASYNYRGTRVDLGALEWQASMLSLLGLKVCAQLDSPVVRGYVCHGVSGKTKFEKLMVDQISVGMFDKQFGLASLGGTAGFAVKEAQVAKNGKIEKLEGNLSWQAARVNAGTGWFQLGSYAADLSPAEDGGIAFKLFDLEGEFGVDINGAFGYRGQLSLNGVVKPKENAPAPLTDALSAFTETMDDGSFKVVWPMGG